MIDKSKIKAILFDLDDTLLDSKLAQKRAICEFKKLYKEFDEVSENDFANLWHNITMELYNQYFNKKISFEMQRIGRILKLFENYNLKVEKEEARIIFNKYREIYKKNWILFDNVVDVLEDLKDNYKLAIITNGNSSRSKRKN